MKKKSLEGWAEKDWKLSYFNERILIRDIQKYKSRCIEPVKVRITIKETK